MVTGKRRSLKRRLDKGWWKKQWPWWRICLALLFVVAFFESVGSGVFPSELRSEIPPTYKGYWALLSVTALILFGPLAIGPDWRHQGAFKSFLAVGLLVFWSVTFPRNLIARIYVGQEMAHGSGVAVTPTEFRFVAIEELPSRRGRSFVARFNSADGLTTWRPAGAELTHARIGQCVTLTVRRNNNGLILIEGLRAIDAGSLRDCSQTPST